MTGDGLNDIVLVHDGRIDYWPNLGYGRFGRRVSMANAPLLDGDCRPPAAVPGRPQRHRLRRPGVRRRPTCALLVQPVRQRLERAPDHHRHAEHRRRDALEFADVFGTGTATLVWSRDFTGSGDEQLPGARFLWRGQTVRPHRDGQQHGRDDPGQLCALHPVLPRGPSRPATRGSPRCRSRCRSSTRWRRSITSAGPNGSRRTATTTGISTGGSASSAGSAGSTSSTPSRSRTSRGPIPPATPRPSATAIGPTTCRRWRPARGSTPASTSTTSAAAGRGATPLDYRDLTDELPAGVLPATTAGPLPLDEHDVETGETPAEAYRALRGAQLRTEVYAHDGSAKGRPPVPGERQPLPGRPGTAQERQPSRGLFQPSAGEPDLPLRAQPGRSSDQPRADAGGRCLRQSAARP